MTALSVLLLADSRLPNGGHAHSGGVETAVTAGLLSTVDDLLLFLRGRLATAAPVAAGFSAAGCLLPADADWPVWDRALSARIPSAALRTASRLQGSALLRTVTGIWPVPAGLRKLGKPHQPLVLGAATSAGGGTASDAATLAVHHLLGGACSAAVRLLGLDPLAVAAAQAGVAELGTEVAKEAALAAEIAVAGDDPSALAAVSGPLTELLAAEHAQQEVTLFAS
ncbi:MAG TPA: urease accessory UreF family protein [Pseudonocardiaceae bacterium]|jgi:urease accessory protein|nr:urease accessory UreF family protein [Pseudonocardiaceae bacterium]